MTSVEDISARFDAARETFEVEEGQPTEAYAASLEEPYAGSFFLSGMTPRTRYTTSLV